MCFTLKFIEILFVQLFDEIYFRQRNGIEVNAFMSLEHFADFLNIRQFLAVCPFTQKRTSRKEIRFVLA